MNDTFRSIYFKNVIYCSFTETLSPYKKKLCVLSCKAWFAVEPNPYIELEFELHQAVNSKTICETFDEQIIRHAYRHKTPIFALDQYLIFIPPMLDDSQNKQPITPLMSKAEMRTPIVLKTTQFSSFGDGF